MKGVVVITVTLYLIANASAVSIPYYNQVLENYTEGELETLKEFITIDKRRIDHRDFLPKYQCGVFGCDSCASLKINNQKHDVCIREYNRKSKPLGLTAFYVDGRQVQQFNVLNNFCQRLWGKITGCWYVYSQTPSVGRVCFKLNVNLLYTLVSFDFNCMKHEGDQIKLDTTSYPHTRGQGLLDIDLYDGKVPRITVQPKNEDTVSMILKSIDYLQKKKMC